MSSRGGLLREVMLETGTTQSELSRVSRVHQPSISQFLSGKVELSDEQLDRLLSCMGYRRGGSTSRRARAEPLRTPVVAITPPALDASDAKGLEQWRPTIERNLERLRGSVSASRINLDRWMSLIDRGDVPGLHRVLTGLDRDSIEMREVSPMGGLLSQDERTDVLQMAS